MVILVEVTVRCLTVLLIDNHYAGAMAVIYLRIVATFIVIELDYRNCVLFCHYCFHVEDCT